MAEQIFFKETVHEIETRPTAELGVAKRDYPVRV
jgi:hypothetical protein